MAVAPIELEIRGWLLQKLTPSQILLSLLQRFADPQFSLQDRKATFAFAANAGLYSQGLRALSDLLAERQTLPWAWVLEFFAQAKVNLQRDIKESLLKGSERQRQLDELSLSRCFDAAWPELERMRSEVLRKRLDRMREQRQRLLEKLAFFRNEQMTEEERELLEVLKKMFPGDAEILQLEAQFGERWARHVINRHTGTVTARGTETEISPEALRAMETVIQEIHILSRRDPNYAYDFSVALIMMGLNAQALELMNKTDEIPAMDWLKAEVLLSCRRHVDCLDQLTRLEQRYSDDPETAFSATYLRAQAYWGLNQSHRAIELLEALISVRPQFRSASSLLKEWQGGRSV